MKSNPSTELDTTQTADKGCRPKCAPKPSPTKRAFDNRTPVTLACHIPTPETTNAEPSPYTKHHHNITITNCDEPNMTDDDLRLWKCYYNQQQKLASLPLLDGICYKCRELLFSKVQGHFLKKNKENEDENAPIALKFAYLPDIPYESADQQQWYCCRKCFHNMPLCPSYTDPTTGNADTPSALKALPTAAVKRAISLCSI